MNQKDVTFSSSEENLASFYSADVYFTALRRSAFAARHHGNTCNNAHCCQPKY